jgi:DNA-binding MarR family transcriptional regulator
VRVPESRRHKLERFLELQPIVWAQMAAAVPEEVRGELSSVTAHQLRALVQLARRELTMHELAEAMQVMRPTATVLADRLVARGLVTRVADEHDKRVVRIVPTDHGRSLATRFRAAQRRSVASLFDRLRDEQVDALLDVMETVAGTAAHRASTVTENLTLELAR